MQHVPMQQPAYWAVPPGSNPAGTVAMPYAGATGFQVQNPGQVQVHEYVTIRRLISSLLHNVFPLLLVCNNIECFRSIPLELSSYRVYD